MPFKTLAVCVVLMFVSGCQNKKNAHKKSSYPKKQEHLFLQESVARISDLPDGPFGFDVKKIVKDDSNKENIQIYYQAKNKEAVDYNEIRNSYCSDMELLGWNLASMFDGEELILIFVRPLGKTCVISLRAHGKLVVAILNKKKDLWK